MKASLKITNRRAFHDYEIVEKVEAGLVLVGTEVKSLREGRAHLKEAYAKLDGDEIYLVGCHISPYPPASQFNHEPRRPRKLLLTKKEIHRLGAYIKEKNLTLIPLEIYFKGRWAKCLLALAKGKKLYDKRRALREKDISRETERALKEERGR